MNPSEAEPGAWRASLRRMTGSLLGLARTRLELLAVEVQEEKVRALNLVIWLAVAVALGTGGVLLGLGAVALWLWNLAGFAGLVGLALAAMASAAALLWRIRRRIQSGPAPFAETMAEFEKDGEWLFRKN